ncbi:hypothetical protein BMS3Abin15_00537 [bacterium BMS3Abin15]|nr:hypothetical protein BMS3Abin15_00537 [bacterium BMS3Abin15]HDH07781.1 hypothetical protein [Candidatus Moranbacteria bacterium]HDZ85362.1 hypothetical protein [Candidatus Moranbacteria bacterium]
MRKKLIPYSEKNVFLAILIIALSFVFYYLAVTWDFPDSQWVIDKGNNEKIELEPGEKVTQKFTASRNNLSRIEILFAKANLSPGGKIIMEVNDENCSEKIRQAALNVVRLSSDSTYSFNFPKIKDSAGKTYCLVLYFEETKGKTKKDPRIFIHPNPPAANAGLYNQTLGEEYENQSLAMRPAYQNDSWRENLQELNQRISQYKPWFLKAGYLGVIAFSFIILSILLIVILILL